MENSRRHLSNDMAEDRSILKNTKKTTTTKRTTGALVSHPKQVWVKLPETGILFLLCI